MGATLNNYLVLHIILDISKDVEPESCPERSDRDPTRKEVKMK